MTINEIQEQIIEEFSAFTDWMDKYEYLIELGKNLPLIDEKSKTEQCLIRGCQSRVWIDAEYVNGKIIYKADSDAIITKGIISLLIRVMSDHEPAEIKNADLFFIEKTGLHENLSPTRANGLLAMIKQMRLYAAAFALIHEKELI
ncbi:MAG: SufE family protein [Prevotellaceae bacterium]|jgi:cysteine desulfuration protein SufE|nr:SufE family protein [Prevotellaceae bacterium]